MSDKHYVLTPPMLLDLLNDIAGGCPGGYVGELVSAYYFKSPKIQMREEEAKNKIIELYKNNNL